MYLYCVLLILKKNKKQTVHLIFQRNYLNKLLLILNFLGNIIILRKLLLIDNISGFH